MLSGTDPLVVLNVTHDSAQDNLFHDLPQHQGQADRLVVP